MADEARALLVAGADALAHRDSVEAGLQVLTDALARAADAGSAVIVVVRQDGGLGIVSSFGLDDAPRAALAAAVRDPRHPIAVTAATGEAGFDVLPIAPGGPALRSHLPLAVTRGGTDRVLGVLALAHQQPIPPAVRPILQAGADLAAAIVERHG